MSHLVTQLNSYQPIARLSIAALLLSFLLSCSSSPERQASSNISFDFPQALVKSEVAGGLSAYFLASNGTDKKWVELTISGETVSGTMTIRPGNWRFEVHFYQVAPSGSKILIAFIPFRSRDVGGSDLALTYKPSDIFFDDKPKDGVSPSVSPDIASPVSLPSSCVKKFDCDGDGYSNWEEIQGGSNPENPKSVPSEKPPGPPVPGVSPCKLLPDNSPPNIKSFEKDTLIQSGGSFALSWEVENCTTVSIDNGIGTVFAKGTKAVSPSSKTTYRLTATKRTIDGDTRTSTKEVTINVNHPPVFGRHTTPSMTDKNPASLSWEATDSDSDCLTVVTTVYFGRGCTGAAIKIDKGFRCESTGTQISDLEPTTDYSYSVTFNDERGGAAVSSCRNFTTGGDSSLVGWWRLDEGSGPTAKDLSGNGNEGTLIGPTGLPTWLTTGISGGALSFDGVDDYIEIKDRPSLNPASSLTLSAWVKPAKLDKGAGNFIISKYVDGPAPDMSYRLNFMDGKAQIFVSDVGGSNWMAKTADLPSREGEFVHVVGTFRSGGYDDPLTLYLNGVPVSATLQKTGSFSKINISKEPVRIGAGRQSDKGLVSFFNGTIDEVAIYGTDLSAREVRQRCARISPAVCNPVEPVPVNPIHKGLLKPDNDGKIPPLEWISADDATCTLRVWKIPTATGVKEDKNKIFDKEVGSVFSTTAVSSFPTLDYRTSYLWEVTACSRIDPKNCVTGGPWQFTTMHQGLVGWWRFDEGSGTTAKDSSGKGNDGTLNNFALSGASSNWVDGTRGKALSFDGVNDFVNVAATSLVTSMTSEATLEGWFKTKVGSASPDRMMVSIGGMHAVYVPSLTDAGAVQVFFDGKSSDNPAVGSSLNNDSWHHLVATSKGGMTNTYIDGMLTGKLEEPFVLPVLKTVSIGSQYDGTTSFFSGLLDDIAVYNRALSTTEIRASCRRNDPTGSTCALDDVPEQVNPRGGLTLPPTRAFLSWKPGIVPLGKTFDHYDLCYSKNGDDLAPTLACAVYVSRTVPYYALDPLTKNSTGYRWKVRTCYTDKGCSDYSPVWSFSTDDSLLGWWKFDETTGTTASDASGNLKTGTLKSAAAGGSLPVWKPDAGILGGALQFDGIDDYVAVTDQVMPTSSSSSFTMSGWVNIASPVGAGTGLSGAKTILGTVNSWAELTVLGDQPAFGQNGGGWFLKGGGIPINSWHYVVGTFDSGNGVLYVDGVQTSYKSGVNFSRGPHGATNIGVFTGSGLSEFMYGLIDEPAIFNKALPSETIKNDFCALEALAGTDMAKDPRTGVCR